MGPGPVRPSGGEVKSDENALSSLSLVGGRDGSIPRWASPGIQSADRGSSPVSALRVTLGWDSTLPQEFLQEENDTASPVRCLRGLHKFWYLGDLCKP